MNCSHCGKDVNPVSGQRYCPFCGELLEVASPRDDSDAEPVRSDPNAYCPWEDQENLGFVKGISETVKQSLLSPQAFFSRCPRSGGFVVPLLYALIVEATGTLVSFLWVFSSNSPFLDKLALSGNITLLVGLMIPVVLFLSVIMQAGAVHVSLLLLGSAREEFEATFRVVCYASGPELLDVIPLIGGWAALVWKTFLIIIGLREVHRISTGLAILAIVLPSLIWFGLIGLAFALVARTAGLV